MCRFQAAFSLGVLLAVAVVLGPTGAGPVSIPHRAAMQARRAKPNFIVVLCDDLGYGDIEPYGGSIPTPAIDRIAREGLVDANDYTSVHLGTHSRARVLTW